MVEHIRDINPLTQSPREIAIYNTQRSITTATRVDHLAEHFVAVWQPNRRLHLSHSRSALPAESVGDGQLVTELTGTAD